MLKNEYNHEITSIFGADDWRIGGTIFVTFAYLCTAKG